MNFGLIGASTTAAAIAIKAIRNVVREQLIFVNSGSRSCAENFAATHGIGHPTTDPALLLADPLVRAVDILSTNDHHHAQAIAAGKHVVCERPLALVAKVEGQGIPAVSGRDGVKSLAVAQAAVTDERTELCYGSAA